jgi:cardiolipin synthase
VFAQDWFAETEEVSEVEQVEAPPAVPGSTALRDVDCQLVPSGPGYVAENNLRLFTSLIYGATRRISLTSPYFVPDESLLYAVTTAAQRGIDIELFVSELSDQFMVGHAQASYYEALLRAGVRIYLYPAPYILHSKHFTIDDDVAVLGSSNMDMRSFALNYEISLMLLGSDAVTAMRAVEDTYRSLSRELTLDEWSGRSARLRYVDTVMRLTAALQ